jgi:hypothetical protein
VLSGCKNEQHFTKSWSFWPRFLASSFPAKEEVALWACLSADRRESLHSLIDR